MSLKIYETREDGSSCNVPLHEFVFPGGEVGIKVPSTSNHVIITATIVNSEEVIKLLMLTDALRRTTPGVFIDLIMPYVPYARQDRVMVPGESLSIKVFCNLINSQKYHSVQIWDPHSDVTPALLDNCKVLSQASILNDHLPFGEKYKTLGSSWGRVDNIRKSFIENTILIAPDAGAMKKIGEVAKVNGFTEVIQASKVRDVATGKILETKVDCRHIGNKNFLIVDDICDGGRTFLELAKVLRPLTNGKIILYVTHGIFSAGMGVFKDVIDEVYCANSFEKFDPYLNLTIFK